MPETLQIDPFAMCNSPNKLEKKKKINHSRNVHVGILDGRKEKYIYPVVGIKLSLFRNADSLLKLSELKRSRMTW